MIPFEPVATIAATRCPRGWATVCDPCTREDGRPVDPAGSCTIVHARHRPQPALAVPEPPGPDPHGSLRVVGAVQGTAVDDAGRGRPCTTLRPATRPAHAGSTGRTRSPPPWTTRRGEGLNRLPAGSSDALPTSTTTATTIRIDQATVGRARFSANVDKLRYYVEHGTIRIRWLRTRILRFLRDSVVSREIRAAPIAAGPHRRTRGVSAGATGAMNRAPTTIAGATNDRKPWTHPWSGGRTDHLHATVDERTIDGSAIRPRGERCLR
jgi:hypothetical protein